MANQPRSVSRCLVYVLFGIINFQFFQSQVATSSYNRYQVPPTFSADPSLSVPTNTSSRSTSRVPFYIYPFDSFPISWGKCNTASVITKHDHTVHAFSQLVTHPWRVSNPLEAQLAILPINLDHLGAGACDAEVNIDAVKNEVSTAVHQSGIFPNVRHLFIQANWQSGGFLRPVVDALYPAGIVAEFENFSPRCAFSIGYTSQYATTTSVGRMGGNPSHLPNPSLSGVQRKYTFHMVGQVNAKGGYSDRLALFRSKGELPSPYIVTEYVDIFHNPGSKAHLRVSGVRKCNATAAPGDNYFNRCMTPYGDQDRSVTLHAMERANFTLCLRGDTPGSDRWIQAMTAGTALVTVVDDQRSELKWLPYPHVIPWDDIVITIPRKDYLEDPARELRRVLETTSEERLVELQRLSRHYVADIDWLAYKSRAVDNMLRSAVDVPC